ncbi:MAG: TetR/AcrR family transcriptional regulator [Gammaproteobacteria bacterium]|nr:TetR/AcrR family transcriptional regulator [Gammaproteobacteria bacterium]
MSETSSKKSFDRDSWLKKALDVLFSHGISHVKVEVLARELDVTKGSFYWHFKNRDDLLHGMVDWWRDQQIQFLTRLDLQRIDDPAGLIKSVIAFTHHTDDSRHDVAMREFARFDTYAAAAVAEVDQRRVDYLATLFRAAKFSETEAVLRARALYFYQVGEYTTSLSIDSDLRDELAERRFKLLICRPLDEQAGQD